jgi:glycosyltransferase involved in cell wall biosynthesis
MKILMFGWEFPPHISGGLGTACYGLTKGLTKLKNISVIFVVPKAFGDEDQTGVQLIGANNVPINQREVQFDDISQKMDYLEIDSQIVPYVSEEEFWQLKSGKYSRETKFVHTDDSYKIDFSGSYGPGLFSEIKNYALVSEIIARKNTFDLIHAHDWLAYPAGIAAKHATGKPLIIHVHATEFDRSGGNVNPTVYAIEREGMEMADKIIAVSNLTRNTIIEKYEIPPEKITTVYNAVEPVGELTRPIIKKGVNEKVVTFLGRITMQKGPEYFIEAAHLVLKKMNNARFVMAGSGDMMNGMISRVAELGITDKFHFTGFLQGDDVYQMFEMTDVFVMPSISEPFGIVPLEAMQSGVPVIISNQSGVAEILENALKIDFWDTHAMADAIYGLLNYPSLAAHLKKGGKKEVDNLKWIHSARNVKKVYESALHSVTQI